jgi:antitoxin component YwqK of YwqJK toxin-antitoxin module/Tfp pilus assembly protein PilF
MNHLFRLTLALAFLFAPFAASAQVDEEEYKSSGSLILEGRLYEMTGKYEKAISAYKKCHPNDTNYTYATLRLASAYSDNHEDSMAYITAEKGLTLRSVYKADFYNIMGISNREMAKYDEAHKVFDKGIELFPYMYLLPYNKGMTYVKQKKYTEAVACFQKTIEINPFYRSAHFQLGKALTEQGRLIPALLAYEYFLALESRTERANKVVVQMEDLYGGEIDADPEARLSSSDAGDQCFDYLVDQIESKKALNPSYKNLTKLQYKFVRQRQLLFETLKYEEDSKNWFMQNYVPFFVEMQKKEYYVIYTYHTLATVSDAAEQKAYKKNYKKIEAFKDWAREYRKFHSMHPAKLAIADQKNLKAEFHDNGVIFGVGKEDPVTGKLSGEWIYYHDSNGLFRGKGSYDSNGKATGEWRWYYELNGLLREIQNFKDGKLEGDQELFFNNGAIKERTVFKADVLSGPFSVYRSNGAKTEEGTMKNGKPDGIVKTFFADGTIRSEMNFSNGLRNGRTKEYFADGSDSRVTNFLNGKEHGEFLDYSELGKLLVSGQYTNGIQTGHWTNFYSTGEKLREGDYTSKGYRVGPWKEYHRNGNLETEATYGKKGVLNGELYMYDDDGIKYNHNTYKSGVIQQMRYYNKDGKELLNQKLTGRRLAVIEYHPNGSKAAEGELVNNLREGEWKFFSEEGGWLESKYEYKGGERIGEGTTYHANGRPESKGEYDYDMRHGFFKFFHTNGQISSQGWYQFDSKESEWVSFNPAGVMISKQYFISSNNYGNQFYYDNKGRMVENNFIRDGWMHHSNFYDTTGKTVVYKYAYDSSAFKGELRLPYPSGKNRIEQNYVNGRLQGTSYGFYYNGEKQSERQLLNGDDHGVYKSYYLNGQLRIEINMRLGNRQGITKTFWENGNPLAVEYYTLGSKDDTCSYFHENGKLRRKGLYRDGEAVGEHRFYSPEGELTHVRYYEAGALTAYAYNGSDGKLGERKALRNGNGTITAYFANGNKSFECTFENGFVNGSWKEYYLNGAIYKEENYEFGDYEGVQKHFYADGKPMAVLNYKAGDQHLEQRYYHENGQLKRLQNWIWGEMEGESLQYDTNGQQIRREVYHDGHQTFDSGIVVVTVQPITPPKTTKPAKK